jgi:transposase-like protein
MARYSEAFKSRAVGKLLAPHNITIEDVAQSIGVRVMTLERWRDVVRAKPVRERAWPDQKESPHQEGSSSCQLLPLLSPKG